MGFNRPSGSILKPSDYITAGSAANQNILRHKTRE
jgi:hypothetical protein